MGSFHKVGLLAYFILCDTWK